MKSCVYWFSGTGNSLWAAKALAGHLDAETEPMARYTQGEAIPDADRIVLVFPVYNHLIPWLTQRFITKFDNLAGKPVYALCTYGDSPGISLEYLSKRIEKQGGTLAGGSAVQMPYNYVSPTKSLRSVFQPFKLREIPEEKQEQLFAAARVKLAEFGQYILAGKRGTIETEYERIEHLSDRLHLRDTLQKQFWLKKAGYRGKARMTSVETVQLMDTGFFATDACTGCQTCARVCPVGNIRMEGGKPGWLHRCEQCFACLQWCPRQAVQFGQGTRGGIRYRHPMIKRNEIIIHTTDKE